jgi:uncharacterized membrane protein YkvA (DUF1232 family)
MAGWIGSVKQWARAIKRDVIALWIAARDPKTPMAAKLVAGAVAAYALSSIDLIPDFIPVLGYLDDLLIVPLGILLAIRMIPPDLMTDFRQRAALQQNRPSSRAGLVAIVLIWLAVSALAGRAAYRYVYPA